MFNQQYYFQTIRKYVSLFGTLFDEITISRTNHAGHLEALIKVPITYAPKEKMLARVNQDPNIDRPSATVTLPFMAFEMTSIGYDGSRKLPTTNRIAQSDTTNANNFKYQYNPVPYNIGFRLYVYVKNAEDGTKIIEQILPYFTPEFTVSVNLIPEMNVSMDIPIVMNSVSQEDTYSGSFTERQALIWTLDFTLKGYIYGPIKTSAIIKFANSVIYLPGADVAVITEAPGNVVFNTATTIQPGLTANGTPTSNAAASIPVNQITANSDFGYVSNTVYGL
jgi:T4-like virus Myoviridae tail sheath stabiliser